MDIAIDIDRERIAEFCREHHIKRLALFGSVLCDDFSTDSDVDVLVEFEKSEVPGYLGLARIQRKLSELLGREVDISTDALLHQTDGEPLPRTVIHES